MTTSHTETLAHRLHEQGYNVMCSGSDGNVDLVAWDGESTRFIRIATGRAAALAAAEKLRNVVWPPGCSVEVWWATEKAWHHRMLNTRQSLHHVERREEGID